MTCGITSRRATVTLSVATSKWKISFRINYKANNWKNDNKKISENIRLIPTTPCIDENEFERENSELNTDYKI